MTDDELLEQIRGYVRQNQSTYTMDALRARLLADGAPAAAVDRVIAEQSASPYYGPAPVSPAGPPAERWTYGKFFLVLSLAVAANVGVVVGAFFLAFTLDTSGMGGIAFIGTCLLAAGAEVALAVRYAKRNSAITAGLLVAICLTPVAVGVLLLGACLVIIASMGNNWG